MLSPHSESRLLASLPAADFDLLHRHLRRDVLPSQSVLYEPGAPITKAYFPHGGAVSLVMVMLGGQVVEVGMLGRDGMLGGFAALGGHPACHRAVVQIRSDVSVIGIEALRQAAEERGAIRSLLLRHEQALLAQAQQLAACNATHPLEARLCRWLLQARDACGRSTLETTQESIAELLGVRRTSVSFTAHGMQMAGIIRTRRGQIELLDVPALQRASCECYGNIALQYDRLLRAGELEWDVAQIA